MLGDPCCLVFGTDDHKCVSVHVISNVLRQRVKLLLIVGDCLLLYILSLYKIHHSHIYRIKSIPIYVMKLTDQVWTKCRTVIYVGRIRVYGRQYV